MTQRSAHTRITIIGGGTAGWMAAAVLAPLSQDGYAITLVESEEIGTVGVGEATIPQINLYNQALGIDEDAFLKATQGTFKLGIEFVDWGRLGFRYMHAFGDVGRDVGIVPFQHYWRRARTLGVARDLSSYALNEIAARAGKIQRGKLRTTDALPAMPYAFHFDASLYAGFLRKIAEDRGVQRVEGKIVDVTLDGQSGNVASVKLEGDRSVGGDLFLDCSGFRGLLIEGALETGYEEWSRWLPCDSAIAVPCAHGPDSLAPYTRATARSAGWQWRIPLQHRVGNGHVYASAFLSVSDAEELLMSDLDGPAQAQPRQLRFVAGRRRKFWNRNVIALGLASGFLEPLESTSIHLVQSGLQRLLKLLPQQHGTTVAADEFNRQTCIEYERVRDFLILHYKLTERDDSEFWRACRDMAIPGSLQHKIELFRQCGHIVREDQDLFSEPAWLQVMVGQGVVPQRHHPMADGVSEQDLKSYMETWEALLQREVRQMPRHQDLIAQQCAALAA